MINNVSKSIMERFRVNKFVETGILQGDTLMIVQSWFIEWYGNEFNSGPWVSYPAKNGSRHPQPMPQPYFARMYEVDFNENIVEYIRDWKAQGNVNIQVDKADSTKWLQKSIDGGEFRLEDSIFFYLDAHDDSSLPEVLGGSSEPERSPKKQPLRDEIREILKLKNSPIISADDWWVPGKQFDNYHVERIRDLIRERTDVVFYTRDPNLHGKHSIFIFIDQYEPELRDILSGLPLIKQRL